VSPTLAQPLNLTKLNATTANLARPLTEWEMQTARQLWLAKVSGVSSKAASQDALLALHRLCSYMGDNSSSSQLAVEANATEQLRVAVQVIQYEILPVLRSNRSMCNELLKQPEAETNRVLREQLDAASSSAGMAIKAHEKLVDVSTIVLSGNVTTCFGVVTASLSEPHQYSVQTELDTVNTANIILAALMLVLSLMLMVMHPLPDGWGSMIVFIIAASYMWGYSAYMAAYYSFQLNEVSAWVTSSWWRNYYSVYLIGLAGWLLVSCLIGMLYSIMLRNPWLLGVFAGVAIGSLFGVQINTVGIWTLGYNAGSPEYLTQACCMGAGAALFIFIFALWSGVSPSMGGMQHMTAMFIGSYLFVKSIGVLIGSYPNEFNMEPPGMWETYVYISSMWVLFILLLAFQGLVYGIFRPAPVAKTPPPAKKPSSVPPSNKKKEYVPEEKVPLLAEPVGSASDARNRMREQEVVEFGGIRALRPEQENRKMFV